MSDVPETHYTRSADGTSLAYQVTGSGALDLVIGSGNGVPLDLLRDDPGFMRVSKRLGTFSRTIWVEPRRGRRQFLGWPTDFSRRGRATVSNHSSTSQLWKEDFAKRIGNLARLMLQPSQDNIVVMLMYLSAQRSLTFRQFRAAYAF